MSGDDIHTLKIGAERALNNEKNLHYVQRLLEPFENVSTVGVPSDSKQPSSTFRNVVIFTSVGLVLTLNFPKLRDQMGLNQYVIWAISALLLLGALY
jgi:hypothetical protein